MAQQPCHAACDSQSTLVSSGTRHGTFQRRAGSSAVVREGIASPGRTTYLPHVPNAEHRNCRNCVVKHQTHTARQPCRNAYTITRYKGTATPQNRVYARGPRHAARGIQRHNIGAQDPFLDDCDGLARPCGKGGERNPREGANPPPMSRMRERESERERE